MDQLTQAQLGESNDPKTRAALQFALELTEGRGKVGPDSVQNLRNHGFSDEEIVEILAHVALNLFTNYTNVAFDVPVDFPAISLRKAA